MVIDVFSKYGWIIPLKSKTGLDVAHALNKIFNDRKCEKLWVDKGKEFYNKHVKSLGIDIYSTENEEKSSVVERWNRTMKEKMFKYCSANSTRRYIDILDELVNNYNNTKHSSIKMTPVEANPPTYKITDYNGEEIHGTFYEQELQKTNQEIFRIEIFRSDSDRDGRGGGVAIYIQEEITTLETNFAQLNSDSIEQMWRDIRLGNNSILLGCIYRPHDLNDEILKNCIASIKASKAAAQRLECDFIIIYGDFNFSNTFYEYIEIGGGVATTAHVLNERPGDMKFQDCLNECLLTQLITFKTYRSNRFSEPNSTLDLVITDKPDLLIEIKEEDSFGDTPMGQSHALITGRFVLNDKIKVPPIVQRKRYIWSRADYANFSLKLSSTNWKSLFENCSANECYNLFLEVYDELATELIPSTTLPFKKKHEPWITDEVLKAVRTKQELWNKYIAQRQAQRSMQKCNQNFEISKTIDGTISTDLQIICTTLNNYFQSVFVNEPDGPVPELEPRTDNKCILDENIFSINDIRARLANLDESKSLGVDNVHPRVLKHCAEAFALPLTLVFKKSFSTSTIPDLWKKSNVTPIFKKGSKLRASNYRPVSLTSIPCKIFESILHEKIMLHCNLNGLISIAQHGFVQRKSCLTNLLETRDFLTEAAHKKYPVDMIYTDFAKAFDKVPHIRLLSKLKAYGISGKALMWINAWLNNRQQRFVIDTHSTAKIFTSDWKKVTSGVPQGSVLGPLLFVLFINDLPDNITSQFKLYADDSKIMNMIKSNEDMLALQSDIDQAIKWSHKWLMFFNVEKCKTMHVGRGNRNSNQVYSMTNTEGTRRNLEETETERDLGIRISNDLKVRAQVESAVSVAYYKLGLLKEVFRSRSIYLWRTLYITYVRPHLEFAIQAWSPHLKKDINMLERVQRRATKVSSIKHHPYEQSLNIFRVTTLEERRARGDLIEQFKIINKIDDVNFFVPQRISNNVYCRRSHNKQLHRQIVSDCEERHHFFTNRVTPSWNMLPQEAIDTHSVNLFKSFLS
ncbi:uncharacterized protein LOC136075783 [Hydra vulgaris]|uniref:Uncharacterized protein LOC136075783 n=1 Tax=Hydra vulgaris TaxID=6087 RepID=A0ABM4B8V5_HYDVU